MIENLEMDSATAVFNELPLEDKEWLLALVSAETLYRRLNKLPNPKPDVAAKIIPILLATCRTLKLSPISLKGKFKTTEYTEPRYMIFNLLYQNGYTCTGIGRLFNKNHATVLHGIDRHAELVVYHVPYKNRYERVLMALRSPLQLLETEI